MSSLIAILILFAVLIGLSIILLRPSLAFLLVMCMFALEQLLQSYVPFLRDHHTAVNYAIFVVVCGAVSLRVFRRDPIMLGHKNLASTLMFCQYGLYLLAIMYSPVPELAFENVRTMGPYMVLFLILAPLLLIDIDEVYWLLVWCMVLGTGIALLLLVNPSAEFYGGRLMIDLGMTGQRKDQFGNPLAVAQMCGTIALIAALIVPHRPSMWLSMLRIAAFVIGLGLAISSGSRGQVLATVVAGFMFYPLARKLNSPTAFLVRGFGAALLAFGVLIIFQLFVGEQNRARWDIVLMIKDITLRFDAVWRYTGEWLSTPSAWLFGLGTNAWLEIEGTNELQGNYVHNVAVEILCEHGLVGAGIFVAATVLVIRGGLRLWRQYQDDSSMRSVAAIMLAIGAFELFNALKQGSMTSSAPFFWWFIIVRVATFERRNESIVDIPQDDADELSAFASPDEGYAVAR